MDLYWIHIVYKSFHPISIVIILFTQILCACGLSGSGVDDPVLICGGGIMGCATAYYLAMRGVKSIIIEARDIASGASGKAGN